MEANPPDGPERQRIVKRCTRCVKERDTRPYGPEGSEICFECKDKDPEAPTRFIKKLDKAMRRTGKAQLTKEGPIPYIGPGPGERR